MAAKDLELAVEGARERRRSLASSIVRRIKHSQLSGAFDGLREATEQQREQRQVTARAMAAWRSPIQVQVFEAWVKDVHAAKVQKTDEAKDVVPASFTAFVPYKSFEDSLSYTRTTLSPPVASPHVVVGSDPQISMGVINKQFFVPPREMQSSAKLCAVGAPVHAVRASNLTKGNIDSTSDAPYSILEDSDAVQVELSTNDLAEAAVQGEHQLMSALAAAEAPFAAKLRSANTALQVEVESLTERLGVKVFSCAKFRKESQGVVALLERRSKSSCLPPPPSRIWSWL